MLKYLRSFRIFGIALFDLITAYLGTVLILLWARNHFFPDLPREHFVWLAILTFIPIGIVAHVLFGVNTTLNYRLGLSHKP